MASHGRRAWSAEEEYALRSAVEQYRAAGQSSGVSWVGIKSDPEYKAIFECRTWQNLKDKWRNMRVSPNFDSDTSKQQGMQGKGRTTIHVAERDATHGRWVEKEDNFRRISLYVAGSMRSSTTSSQVHNFRTFSSRPAPSHGNSSTDDGSVVHQPTKFAAIGSKGAAASTQAPENSRWSAIEARWREPKFAQGVRGARRGQHHHGRATQWDGIPGKPMSSRPRSGE